MKVYEYGERIFWNWSWSKLVVADDNWLGVVKTEFIRCVNRRRNNFEQRLGCAQNGSEDFKNAKNSIESCKRKVDRIIACKTIDDINAIGGFKVVLREVAMNAP